MKWALQLALYKRAKADPRIHLIIGDVGAVMFAKFRADFPDRFLNVGLCEQSMISLAAGMASEGLRPIVYTITPFLIERAFEQIKLDIDQMKLPVGLIGYSDDTAGPTHQELAMWHRHWPFPNVPHCWIFPENKEQVGVYLDAIDLDCGPWFLGLRGSIP
jgi:transketolase C-terminal domain/subunit